MSPTAIPLMAAQERIGFPIRPTDDVEGARRLLQLRDVTFDFMAAGTRFRTRARSQSSTAALEISAELGRLPCSIQSPSARERVMALLANPPAGARARLTDSSLVTLDAEVTLRAEITPVRLVAALAEWVIDPRPWIAPVAATLVAAPSGTGRPPQLRGGTVKIWPG